MYRPLALIAVAFSLLALAGCASAASSSLSGPLTSIGATGPGAPPSADAGQPSSNAGEPSSDAGAGQPSSAVGDSSDCTSRSCIVQDAKSGLVGAVAKDESVITALTCYQSSVKHPDPGIYTVSCVATYSDGNEWDGIASVLLSQNQVTWEPTEEISGGN